jgi:pSer/pThr/pTyr-binding forkhead associated (FHA) protein
MIECLFCHSVFPENTLFCEECGSYLPPGDGEATAPLTSPVEVKGGRGAYKTLILCVRDGGCIELPLSREVIIGRLDAGRSVFPDVDLTNEQGIEKGLSRRHARISLREGQVILEDLHSLNGTFLNTSRLVPDVAYPLRDGDQVQLGKLVLTVRFV